MKNESGKRPMCHNIIVKVEVVEEKTEMGIIIPDQVKNKEQQEMENGTIVGIGADAWSDKTDKAQVGDKVMFGRYGGQYFKGSDGCVYRIMADLDIRAVTIVGIDS